MEQAEQTREEGMTRQRLSPQSKAGSKTSNDAAVLQFLSLRLRFLSFQSPEHDPVNRCFRLNLALIPRSFLVYISQRLNISFREFAQLKHMFSLSIIVDWLSSKEFHWQILMSRWCFIKVDLKANLLPPLTTLVGSPRLEEGWHKMSAEYRPLVTGTIVGKKSWDPESKPLLAKIRKVEARLGKFIQNIRKVGGEA